MQSQSSTFPQRLACLSLLFAAIMLGACATTAPYAPERRFWLAPFTFEGRQVWVGQISRDIGIKLSPKSPSLTTHIIDLEVDLAREYLLHSLLAGGFVEQFGFVKGSTAAARTQPASNLTGDPYFSDGMRLVVLLSPDPLPLVEVRSLLWEQSSAPVAEGQTEEANRYVRPIDAKNLESN